MQDPDFPDCSRTLDRGALALGGGADGECDQREHEKLEEFRWGQAPLPCLSQGDTLKPPLEDLRSSRTPAVPAVDSPPLARQGQPWGYATGRRVRRTTSGARETRRVSSQEHEHRRCAVRRTHVRSSSTVRCARYHGPLQGDKPREKADPRGKLGPAPPSAGQGKT